MSDDRFPNLYIRILWHQRHWNPGLRKILRDWIPIARAERERQKVSR